MTPIHFPQENTVFGPPPDLSEEQVRSLPAYRNQIVGGSCDGEELVVVAWVPQPVDMARLMAGGPIYLTCIGGLPPHYLSTDFETASHPT